MNLRNLPNSTRSDEALIEALFFDSDGQSVQEQCLFRTCQAQRTGTVRRQIDTTASPRKTVS
jgi:hypothetical protein